MPGSILGTAVRRVEDPDLLVGRGALRRRPRRSPASLHLAVRALAVRARAARVDRRRRRAARCPGSSPCSPPPISGSAAYEGLMQLNAQCVRPAARRGQGAVRRRRGRGGGGRDARRGGRRGRGGDRRVRRRSPAVADPEAALAPDAPLQFEELGSNLAAAIAPRDQGDVLDGADVIVRGADREPAPRGDADGGRARSRWSRAPTAPATSSPSTSRRRCRTASPTASRRSSSSSPAQLRVVAPHVGGAFGGKPGLAAEHCVAVAAALRLQRPVKWVETRSENLIAMPHGRGQVQYVELGLQARRHDRRACGAGSSATPARTRASAARSRWVRRA